MKTLLLHLQAQAFVGLAGLTILLSMYGTSLGMLLEARGEKLLRHGERLIGRRLGKARLEKHE